MEKKNKIDHFSSLQDLLKIMLFLVCGYRRTGKDTLVKMFDSVIPFNWIVYGTGDKNFQMVPVEQISLAQNLRDEVNEKYDIKYDSNDYDEFKETLVHENKTYRDLLIEHAAYRRSQNIDYWVSKVSIESDQNFMISDWRYVNEMLYLSPHNPITIRLFRSEVPIPSYDIISEHQLDNIVTDFLLVTSESEFDKACELFPQYKSYVRL